MKATIIRVGNSRGIRLPKPVIEQCGFTDEVDIEVRNHELIIRPIGKPREGWDRAYLQMSERGDDQLLDHVAETEGVWEQEEWEW